MIKLFLSLVLALTLLPMRAADDKTMQRIAAIYQSVASPSELRGNTELISLLTEVLQRADQTSLTALNTYGKYIYANGMLAVVEQSIAKMPAALKDTEEGKNVLGNYYAIRPPKVGEKVPDFTLATPDGKQVRLYDFIKGKKCVIVDFWASWCSWCRKESPNIDAVWKQYKSQDFDVISVSFDDKRER